MLGEMRGGCLMLFFKAGVGSSIIFRVFSIVETSEKHTVTVCYMYRLEFIIVLTSFLLCHEALLTYQKQKIFTRLY